VKRKRAPAIKRPVKEKELDAAEPAVKSVKVQEPEAGQGMTPLPPVRTEPPPSANSSKRGGRFCAKVDVARTKRKAAASAKMRSIRIPFLSRVGASFWGDQTSCGYGTAPRESVPRVSVRAMRGPSERLQILCKLISQRDNVLYSPDAIWRLRVKHRGRSEPLAGAAHEAAV
jgi:hypothetical protein